MGTLLTTADWTLGCGCPGLLLDKFRGVRMNVGEGLEDGRRCGRFLVAVAAKNGEISQREPGPLRRGS